MFYTDTWIYFHVPKTSGTNILLNAEKYGDVRKGYSYNPERHNPIWYWETGTKLEGKKLYTTVRNPYSRIVSLWWHLNHFASHSVTFERFILDETPLSYFLRDNIIMGDYKWETTTRMIDHLEDKSGKIPKNLQVFKMEEDLSKLEKEMGIDFRHTRHKAFPDKGDYRKYYTDKIQEVVYKRYERDFLKFDYEKDL